MCAAALIGAAGGVSLFAAFVNPGISKIPIVVIGASAGISIGVSAATASKRRAVFAAGVAGIGTGIAFAYFVTNGIGWLR